MNLDDVIKWLAVIGGITGPAGLVIAYLTYRRDVGRLRVHVRRRQRITQGSDNPTIRAMLKHYVEAGESPPMDLYTRDPDKTWAIIEVTNVGRRKVRLLQIGWKEIGAKYALPGGYFGYQGSAPWLPCDLDEGQGRDFPIEDSHFANAGYVFARISTGRSFYGGFASGWRGLWYRHLTWFEAFRNR